MSELRVRSKVESESSDYYYQNRAAYPNPTHDYTEGAPLQGEYTSYENATEMTDIVTPDFHKRSAQGEIINNPMSKLTTITIDALAMTSVRLDYSKVYNGQTYYGYSESSGTLPSTNRHIDPEVRLLPGPTLDDYQDLIDLAVNKAWAKVGVTDVQSLVMVAEAEKTVVSLVNIFKRFIKVAKAIKKLDAKTLVHEVSGKELADRYMELRYAIRPLLYDTIGTIAALQTTASDLEKRMTFRGGSSYTATESDESHYDYSFYNSLVGGDHGFTRTWNAQTDVNVEVRAGVLTALEQLHAINTWGVTQPFESLWEIVPFSFVIDWFLNVGDTIGAWTPNYGIKALSSWWTRYTRIYQYCSCTHSNEWFTGGGNPISWVNFTAPLSGCFYGVETLQKVREPNPSRSIVPHFQIKLDALKLIDLVIIAKQIIFKDGFRGRGLRY